MRESDLTDVWAETLQRMRACFDFAGADDKESNGAKDAQGASAQAAPRRKAGRRERETDLGAAPSR